MSGFEVALPDGASLAGRDEGTGPAVLLISGLGGTGGFWDPVVGGGPGRFRFIRFDQRGIGGSRRGAAPCTIARLAADAAAVLGARGVERAILAGHSTGGCIAQELALELPGRAAGLLLSGAWGRPGRYMTALFRSRLAVLRAAPRDYAAGAALSAYPPEWLDRNWSRYEAALAAAPVTPEAAGIVAERIEALLAFDRSADLPRIAAPAAVIGAADDAIVPAFLQRELGRLLPGAPVDILGGGGHFFPVTRTADYLAALIRFAQTADA